MPLYVLMAKLGVFRDDLGNTLWRHEKVSFLVTLARAGNPLDLP